MKKDNPIQVKSFQFALRAVKIHQYLYKERKEYTLSKQFLRSATSVGANIEEALGGQSQKDFLSKKSIAYKEARETHYWIRLLYESKYINKETSESLLTDLTEILKIIGSIQISMKKKIGYK